MKILVTGFDPFGKESINPASEAVLRLPDMIADAEIMGVIIPTVFHKSLELIEQYIVKYDPDVILSVGQAGGRAAITVERIGINIDDARICDNAGQQIIDVPIVQDGPAAYFSTLPIKAMVKAIQDAGIDAAVSNTAGTFVCNHLMYGTLHLCSTKFQGKRAGFVHIPFLPEQVMDKPNVACMELDDIVKGLDAAIEAIVTHDQDISISGGLEH